MYTVGGIFTIPSYGWFMTMFYPNYPIFCLYTENDGAIKNFGQTRAWTNPWCPKMIAWSPPTSDYIIKKSIPLARFIYQSSGLNGMICSGYIEPPVVRINVPSICLRNLMNDDGQYEVEWFLLRPNKPGGIDLDRSIFIYKPNVLKFGGWRPREGRYCRLCSVTEVCVVAILCGFLVSGGESSGSKGDWWRVGVLGTGWRIVFFCMCWEQWNGGIFNSFLKYWSIFIRYMYPKVVMTR